MAPQRPPRALPGSDPQRIQKWFALLGLGIAAILLIAALVSAVQIGAQRGHLPWPVAQWALTTPLGALALTMSGALMVSAPIAALARLSLAFYQPVDVTDLPVAAWPRPVLRRPGPVGGTRTEVLLGRGQRQRAWNRLALALAALLLLSLLAVIPLALIYVVTYFPDCGASGCPPSFMEQISFSPTFLGLFLVQLSQLVGVAWVERRCGIWFRARNPGRNPGESNLGTYIRRPGVTAEAAAARLQRYTSRWSRPGAQFILLAVLAFAPYILLLCGGYLLSTWLSTQWIPG
jgi:hypothetical protein